VLVVGVECLAVDQWVHRVHALKVAHEEGVGLQLVGKHLDYLGQAAVAGPVVCEGVF
jgi:hypothetical protein